MEETLVYQGLSMSDRKKITLAIVGSLIVHLIIILGLSKVTSLWPDVSIFRRLKRINRRRS